MAAVRLWGTVLSGIMSSGKSASGNADGGADEVLSTEFSMHRVSYFFMVWSSLTFGGIMLIEQYFGRRIFCFTPTNFTQPEAAIGEYCWQHGHFEKSYSSVDFYFEDETWILQSFIYFFIRATVFVVPHLIWQLKYEAWVVAVIKGTVGLVKELQKLWLMFSEVADRAYSEHNSMEESNQTVMPLTPVESTSNHQENVRRDHHRETVYENVPKSPQSQHNANAQSQPTNSPDQQRNSFTSAELKRVKLHKTYTAVMAMTRDVVQITKQQVPRYNGIYYFILGRLIYETLALVIFAAIDLIMFNISKNYDSTDYYCKLPNSEKIRCMVPMMSFQWYATSLALVTCFLMLIINIFYTIYMFIYLFSNSTKETFLDHIPYSEVAADTSWQSCVDRKTYKLLSKLMMQNLCIIHPLNFLESFVNHMKENHEVGEDILSQPSRDLIEMTRMSCRGAETTDGDDHLWRRLIDY